MRKVPMVFVTIAAVGLIAWQGKVVRAQDEQGAAAPSTQTDGAVQIQSPAQMRRGYPGYRLGQVDDAAKKTAEQRGRINLLMEDERKQLAALGADRSLSKEQKKEKYRQIREATRDKIKALLSPVEQKKYEQSQENSRAIREALSKRTAQKPRQ
jgi:hypothetical protein